MASIDINLGVERGQSTGVEKGSYGVLGWMKEATTPTMRIAGLPTENSQPKTGLPAIAAMSLEPLILEKNEKFLGP